MEIADELFFFQGKSEELELYRVFKENLFSVVPEASFRVQKTQVTFTHPKVFACVSFLKARKAGYMPRHYITITFGLLRKADDRIIDIVTEPYPSRWTYHVVVSSPDEVDTHLMSFIKEAADIAARK